MYSLKFSATYSMLYFYTSFLCYLIYIISVHARFFFWQYFHNFISFSFNFKQTFVLAV